MDREVASFSEAWIEILYYKNTYGDLTPSPPSRRRGLKLENWEKEAEVAAGRLLLGGVD